MGQWENGTGELATKLFPQSLINVLRSPFVCNDLKGAKLRPMQAFKLPEEFIRWWQFSLVS